jgi:cyclophilin family peptidyl-prolyl cis-trans isomerase
MKNWYLLVVISLLVVIGVYWFGRHRSPTPATDQQSTLTQPQTQEGGLMDTQDKVATDSSPKDQKDTEGVPVASTVQLVTSKGTVTLQLFSDKAPNTVKNFLTKTQSGFYEGKTFHRVEDWVVQGGDPLGNGTGGGTMPTELNDVTFGRGSLGVARGGNIAVSNDAQFFICTKDCSWLTGQYTNFGRVVSGMEVVDQLEIGDQIKTIQVPQ